MAKKEIIEILKKYIYLIQSEGITVNKAFLFGSYLSDMNDDNSDIDLMIVTDVEENDYSTGKIWSLTKKINSKIEPYIICQTRFNDNNESPLIDFVKRTGLEII